MALPGHLPVQVSVSSWRDPDGRAAEGARRCDGETWQAGQGSPGAGQSTAGPPGSDGRDPAGAARQARQGTIGQTGLGTAWRGPYIPRRIDFPAHDGCADHWVSMLNGAEMNCGRVSSSAQS